MKQSGIYCIQNKKNNKLYIGSSSWLDKRRDKHFQDLRKGKHPNRHLQSSFHKYGDPCFSFFILELVEPNREKLIEREQFHIDNARHEGWDLYNQRILANNNTGLPGWNKGRKLTIKHRIAMSLARTGTKLSSETRKKMSLSASGKKKSDQMRANLSLAIKGHKVTLETREKIRLALLGRDTWMKGKHHRPESIEKNRLAHLKRR